MSTYNAGEFLKTLRKQRGITQEKLCEGICTQRNLSRIENNKQLISKDIFDALMQKLGVNAENYFSEFIPAEEFDFFILKKQISDLSYEGKYDEAKLYFDKISSDKRFSEGINRQFYLYYSSLIKLFTEDLSDEQNYEILNDLNTALKITIPNYKENKVSSYLLTSQEIKILNCIAIIYKRVNRLQDAIELMYQLKECIEKTKIDFDEKAKSYILILFNLSSYLGKFGKHEEVVKICDLAIDACIQSNKCSLFAHVIYNKAYALNLLGDTESCRRLLYQSYYILDAFKNYKDAKIVKEYAEKEHGIFLNHLSSPFASK